MQSSQNALNSLNSLNSKSRLPSSTIPVRYGQGFHEPETTTMGPFRWVSTSGAIEFEPFEQESYLELRMSTSFHDLSQNLRAQMERPGGAPIAETPHYPIPSGGIWLLSIAVPAGTSRVVLKFNKPFPPALHVGDPRDLAVPVFEARVHLEGDRHAHVIRQWQNLLLNQTEMLAGARELTSTAPYLGIDLHGECNVKPPCVYCDWDASKAVEGDAVSAPFDLGTLAEYGPHYENSAALVNCGIGEPFMKRDLDGVLEDFGRRGKLVEMASNGQILTDRNIDTLLGRHVQLYVSLDAATATTYARLRNRNFDRIIDNLRRLISRRNELGLSHPVIYMVFMPMKANIAEIDLFVRLCADLKVDLMVLRPLNLGFNLSWAREGYRFDYQEELLPFEDLVRVSGRATEMCARLGVNFSNQLDKGGALGDRYTILFEEGRQQAREALGESQPPAPAGPAAIETSSKSETEAASAPISDADTETATAARAAATESLGHGKLPLCVEPWKNFYILRRGIYPCCYGAGPIAPMEDYAQAWNGPALQGLRESISKGELHDYCKKAPSCPIVRKLVFANQSPEVSQA